MNFFLLISSQANKNKIQAVIEQDYTNTVVGSAADSAVAYPQLLQLRVDMLIVDVQTAGWQKLLQQLAAVAIKPRILLIGSNKLSAAQRTAAYHNGVDLSLPLPLNQAEFRHYLRILTANTVLTEKLQRVHDLTQGVLIPLKDPQIPHRQQIAKITAILSELGISTERGADDILQLCKLMVDENCSYENIDNERDLKLSAPQQRALLQRVRRSIRLALNNLAALCQDFSDNPLYIEYANTLFGYATVREVNLNNQPQISLPQFFNGLVTLPKKRRLTKFMHKKTTPHRDAVSTHRENKI